MRRSHYILAVLLITCFLILSSTACTKSGSTQHATLPSGQLVQPAQDTVATGRIEVYITDAPLKNKQITSVVLTVSAVEIHAIGSIAETDNTTMTDNTTKGKGQDREPMGSGVWIKIDFTGSRTFDLLKIKGLDQLFASGEVQAGKYTQARLIIDNASVGFSDNTTDDATIPSGEVKFVRSFDVAEGKTTMLTFDFDAEKSVNITGQDKVMIKPVVKLDAKQK